MSRMMPQPQMSSVRGPGEEWQRGGLPVQRPSSGVPSGLLLTGLVVVGLGALAWYYVGADLRRYLKIRSM